MTDPFAHLASHLADALAGRPINLEDLSPEEVSYLFGQLQTQMRTVLDNMPITLSANDEQGRLIAWNKESERISGLSGEEIIGRTDLSEQLFPDPAERAAIMAELIQKGGHYRHFEVPITHQDGTRRWVSFSNISRDVVVPGWANWAIGIDITAIKVAQMAEYKQRLRADALREVALTLSSTLDRDQILDRLMENVGRVLPHDYADIMLIEGEIARVVRSKGYSDELWHTKVKDLSFVVADTYYLHQMFTTGRPIVIPDIDHDPRWVKVTLEAVQRSYAGLPIMLHGKTIGFLNLISTEVNFFDLQHLEILDAFVAGVAVAVQNAELYQQAQALAAVEERQRLARDLHDAVSQNLFSSSIMAESLLRLIDSKPERVKENLNQLYRLNRAAFAEMRALLLELRPAALLDIPITDLIEQLAQAAMGRKSIAIQLDLAQLPEIPDEIKVSLYRIVQECLNNIIKHAHATQVSIRAEHQAGKLTMIIEDNGRGFDPAQVPARAMGLHILGERAQAIGAEMHIRSQPGQGTTITLTGKC